ncbi:unnamed protein product [Pieris macdunnoughi]|uniref:Peptidase S1 domain-containing protein n=1 Tax=Pieris macdunnoughi TaxID=345717 RepID=A0A821U1W6_9NEOP|nr:unnamed protein product [Pieris macdunnoughi]
MKVLFILSVFIITTCDASLTSRIGGGSVGDIAKYPFAISLLRQQGEVFRHQCGGTIISNNAILTAASCFFTGSVVDDAFLWRARVGSSYSNRLGLIHIIRRITTNPDFQQITRVHNVAVVRPTIPFTYGETVQAAYLAGGAYSLPAAEGVQAIGWGVTSTNGVISSDLRETTIWVTDFATCVNRYSELNLTVTDNMLCAGWLGVGIRGQCEGDTGSPLLHNNVVVGVFSHSEGCASPRYPGVNTKVSSYSRWIEDSAVAAL